MADKGLKSMDLPGEDGECQVEADITPQSKKGKQGRLSFETLNPDSPIASLHNKTPGRGGGMNYKSESKAPVNPCTESFNDNAVTKFFTKIDSKGSKNEAQSPRSKNNEEKTEKSVETESKEASVTENVEDGHENEDITETKKDEEHHSDSEEDVVELHETSSSSKENETVDTSHLNETDNMDVDSDPYSDLDDSHGNVDDSHKSDTDCKKTEHEDTDSQDDTSRGGSTRHITPAKNKLLDSKGKERKLTPKQLEKKLEIQKKREMRDKQRQEAEKKLQEQRESRKREKEEKQREREYQKQDREEEEKYAKEQKQKEKEAKEEDCRKCEEAKEEEKKRKEEEKLEAERKKQTAASNFVSFFEPKKPAETKSVQLEQKVENRNFMPSGRVVSHKLGQKDTDWVFKSCNDSPSDKSSGAIRKTVNTTVNSVASEPLHEADLSNISQNSAQCLTKSISQKNMKDDGYILAMKLGIDGQWDLLREVLSFATENHVALTVLMKVNLAARVDVFKEIMSTYQSKFKVMPSNQEHPLSSETLVLVNKDVISMDIHFSKLLRPNLCELNRTIAVSAKIGTFKFKIIAIDSQHFSAKAITEAYKHINTKFANKNTIFFSLARLGSNPFYIMNKHKEFTLRKTSVYRDSEKNLVYSCVYFGVNNSREFDGSRILRLPFRNDSIDIVKIMEVPADLKVKAL